LLHKENPSLIDISMTKFQFGRFGTQIDNQPA